jgi:hypothetical protein
MGLEPEGSPCRAGVILPKTWDPGTGAIQEEVTEPWTPTCLLWLPWWFWSISLSGGLSKPGEEEAQREGDPEIQTSKWGPEQEAIGRARKPARCLGPSSLSQQHLGIPQGASAPQ